MKATRVLFATALASLAILGIVVVCVPTSSAADTPSALRIGVVGTLFRDLPAPMTQFAISPLKKYMSSKSGMAGDVSIVQDPNALSGQLAAKELQLAVFHGFEFAWAKTKHPELKPLVVAIKNAKEQRAVLVVRTDDGAKAVGDLKGRKLAVAKGTREYCRLFVDRACESCGCGMGEFFGEVVNPSSANAAIEGLLSKQYDAAVTDTTIWEAFKKSRPKQVTQLRELQRSEAFPPSVLAYLEGGVDAKTLDGLKKCLLNAHQCSDGKSMLSTWDLARFDDPDADYDAALEKIVKLYPPPAAKE